MSVPEAVKRQEEEANKLYEESYENKEETPEELGEESPSLEESPIEEPQAEEEEVVAEETPSVDFQEQYFSLKGKYDAEVPRMMQEIQQLREMVQQTRLPEPERLDEVDDVDDPRTRLTEDYGESFVEDLMAVARAEVAESLAPVSDRLQATESIALKSGQEKYFVRLTELVPDWQGIVKDPSFVQFVREPDEFSGIPRFTLMQNAESQMDADRMARFYNAFKVRTGKTVTGNRSKKVAALTPGQTSGKSNTGEGSKPDYISASEIEKFATDVALRKFVGREDEQARIEARHNRAIANRWVV